ncbi:MAG: hypothetical protein HEQ22_06035 [Sphingopyxis sp.]|uniref:hypothetical protein n=1 Tax=Sphingopyxis sp. TaxID=1908224 RepID=UPI003D80CE1F
MMTFALALMLAAAPAENAPAADPTGATQTAKPVKAKKICKSIRMTGSTIGRRICKTEAQWNGQAEDGAQSLDLVDQGFKANVGNGAVN